MLLQEKTDVGRSIIKALENTIYFDVTHVIDNEAEFDRLLKSGTVLFAVEIPVNFERALRRGDQPALLVAADATDPVAAGSAMAALGTLPQTALRSWIASTGTESRSRPRRTRPSVPSAFSRKAAVPT